MAERDLCRHCRCKVINRPRRLCFACHGDPAVRSLYPSKRAECGASQTNHLIACKSKGEYRANVWLGTSVENQAAADERIPHLLRVPAAVRFLSCEPLLGPVELSGLVKGHCPTHDFPGGFCHGPCPDDQRISWVIVGGESGPGARPCRVEWIRGIVEQCKGAGVPVFVKQLGSNINTGPHDAEDGAFPRCRRCGHFDFGPCADGTLLCNGCDDVWRGLRDKKGGDISEWPADLRVRQFPDAKVGAAGV